MIEIVPASPAHVGTIAARMREIDRLECSINGRAPKTALRLSLRYATAAWTVKIDGKAEAMFGVSAICLLSGGGSPWLLMTDRAARAARSLVVDGRDYSDVMNGIFPILKNFVHADNSTAIRWLRHLGYYVGPAFDRAGHPMRAFERRADPCVNRLPC